MTLNKQSYATQMTYWIITFAILNVIFNKKLKFVLGRTVSLLHQRLLI
jgi:hypothetical protein